MQYDNKCCFCHQNYATNVAYENQSWLKQVKTKGRQFGVHILQEYSRILHQHEALHHQKFVQNRDSMRCVQFSEIDLKIVVDSANKKYGDTLNSTRQ